MKKGAGVILAVLIMGALFAACSGGGGGGGGGGGETTAMPSVATKVYSAVSTTICPSGGIQVDAGIDDNGNGILDPAEVDSTQYVCNGLNGTNGTNGSDGLTTRISVTSEPAGSYCSGGGLKITAGVDANGNGILDAGEAGTPSYVCSGNISPVANAGPDQKVAASGIQVALDGSGSTDPNGSALTYAWTFASRPVGSLATLSSLIVSNPTFTPDKAGKYALSLMVNDGQLSSLSDTVTTWAGMPVPDTGQTRWYSTAFGDDGDYTINPMFYIDNGDGTILDNVTGLTWQKCSMGQSGFDCATGAPAKYAWDAASTACGSLNLACTG